MKSTSNKPPTTTTSKGDEEISYLALSESDSGGNDGSERLLDLGRRRPFVARHVKHIDMAHVGLHANNDVKKGK